MEISDLGKEIAEKMHVFFLHNLINKSRRSGLVYSVSDSQNGLCVSIYPMEGPRKNILNYYITEKDNRLIVEGPKLPELHQMSPVAQLFHGALCLWKLSPEEGVVSNTQRYIRVLGRKQQEQVEPGRLEEVTVASEPAPVSSILQVIGESRESDLHKRLVAGRNLELFFYLKINLGYDDRDLAEKTKAFNRGRRNAFENPLKDTYQLAEVNPALIVKNPHRIWRALKYNVPDDKIAAVIQERVSIFVPFPYSGENMPQGAFQQNPVS